MSTATGARAARLPMTIQQGATYLEQIAITRLGAPVDLTGASAKLQAREAGALLLTISSPTGGITINELGGVLTITATPAQTEPLSTTRIPSVYDLLITYPDGSVDRILEGPVVIARAVTVLP